MHFENLLLNIVHRCFKFLYGVKCIGRLRTCKNGADDRTPVCTNFLNAVGKIAYEYKIIFVLNGYVNGNTKVTKLGYICHYRKDLCSDYQHTSQRACPPHCRPQQCLMDNRYYFDWKSLITLINPSNAP